MIDLQTKLDDILDAVSNKLDSDWERQTLFEDDLINVPFSNSRPKIDTIYCPVCKQAYVRTQDNFYERIRKGYNEKKSLYLICKRCVERINKEHQETTAKYGEYHSGIKTKPRTKIGRVCLDPLFGLNLYENELALMFEKMSEGKKLEKIRAELEDFRRQLIGKTEHISKKTLQLACFRITPIMYRTVVDCYRPKRVDSTLVMDTFYFTRMRYDLFFLDADYLASKDYTELSATVLIGTNTKGIFGFGLGLDEYESSKRCTSMALKYTSSVLPRCSIKFDGSNNEEKALLEAGIPKDHLISVSKSVCRSYINQVEGAIRALRSLGLGKRAYSLPLSIFTQLTICFIHWNLFQEHVLFDGRWKGRIAKLLRIEAPSNWGTLIREGWQFILSDSELFRKYYPKFKRGPRKENQVQEAGST